MKGSDPRASQGWKPPQSEGPQKTLLIVEDERTTQNLCRVGLRGLVGFSIQVASHGGEAMEILRQRPVDVLVTDLNMPVMDGYNLIALVSERYPKIPILVMTALPESQHQNLPLDLGALRIFPKPVRLSMLMEEIKTMAQREPDGMVRGLTLQSLLQLMEWEKRNATLTVQGPEGPGLLYVRGGQLIHAAYRDTEGLRAAYAILGWRRPRIEFMETCKVDRSIELPLAEILLNAVFIQDTGASLP